jgi:membrane dipeptidase
MELTLSLAQEERARALHAGATVMTCHDHIPPPIDLPLLRAGGVAAKVVVIGVDARLDDPDPASFRASIDQREGWYPWTLDAFRRTLRTIDDFADELVLVRRAADIRHARAVGKIGLLLGSEGGKLIEGRIELLDQFHHLGLRQMQLTWAYSNQLAVGEVEQEAKLADGYFFARDLRRRMGPAGGLTELGQQAIAEMNRLGIILDICHLSRPAMRQALTASTKPVLASHTTAKTLGRRLPSLTDDEIRAIADRGGVIGLHCMTHMLTGRLDPPATMLELLAQIHHIVQIGGVDALALGPDYFYDPYGRFATNSGQKLSFVQGLEDSSKLLNLTRFLVASGYSDEEIRKILGGNLLRLVEETCGL